MDIFHHISLNSSQKDKYFGQTCREKQNTYFTFYVWVSVHHKLIYIKNQRDATLAVLFISNRKITLHISDAFCVHHQEY